MGKLKKAWKNLTGLFTGGNKKAKAKKTGSGQQTKASTQTRNTSVKKTGYFSSSSKSSRSTTAQKTKDKRGTSTSAQPSKASRRSVKADTTSTSGSSPDRRIGTYNKEIAASKGRLRSGTESYDENSFYQQNEQLFDESRARTVEENSNESMAWDSASNILIDQIIKDSQKREGTFQESSQFNTYYDSTSDEIDKVLSQGAEILDYMQTNQKQLSDDFGWKLIENQMAALEEKQGFLNKAADNLFKEKMYWEQTDKATYDAQIAQQKEHERLSNLDVAAEQASVDQMKENVEGIKQGKKDIPLVSIENGLQIRPFTDEYKRLDKEKELIDGQLQDKKNDIRKAGEIQRFKEYEKLPYTADFAKYEQIGKNVKNPTPAESMKGTQRNLLKIDTRKYPVINKVEYGREHAFDLKFASMQGAGGKEGVHDLAIYEQMTDTEVSIYNSLLGRDLTHGGSRADQYLEDMLPILNARDGGELADRIEGKPVFETIYQFGAGIENSAQGIRHTVTSFTEPEKITSPTATAFAAQEVAENMQGNYGTPGKVVSDVAVNVGNMTFSLIASAAFGPAVGAAVMGTGVYGNTYQEALQEGKPVDEARAYAAMNAASEAGLQYAAGGIGALGGKLTGRILQTTVSGMQNGFLKAAATLGISAFSEGAEEYIQEIIDPVFRNLAFDENNEFKFFTEEAAYAAFLGALTTGVLETPSIVVNTVNTEQLGMGVVEINKSEQLLEHALQMDPKSESYKMAENIQQKGLENNATNIGELFSTYIKENGNTDFMVVDANAENDGNINEQTAEEQAADMLRTGAAPQNVAMTDTAVHDATQSAIKGINQQGNEVVGQAAKTAQAQSLAATGGSSAIVVSSAEPVTVTNIAAVQNGDVMVGLDNGKAIPLNEIAFDDRATEQLYEFAGMFDTNTAKAFVNGYDGSLSAENYLQGFTEIYRTARLGESIGNAIESNPYAEALPERAQMIAAMAGENAGTLTNARESASYTDRPLQAYQMDSKGNEMQAAAGVTFAVQPQQRLTQSQMAQIDVLDALGKKAGVPIRIVDTIDHVDNNGNVIRSAANAQIDTRSGEITVALDGVEGAYLYHGMHELVHYIKQFNDDGYTMLEDFVLSELESKGENVQELIDYQLERNKAFTVAEAKEEVVANTVPSILSNQETINRLVQADRTLAQRIADFFKQFVANLKEIVQNLMGKESYTQIEGLTQDVQALDNISDMFFAALEGTQDTTDVSGIDTTQDSENTTDTRDNQEISETDTMQAAKGLEGNTDKRKAQDTRDNKEIDKAEKEQNIKESKKHAGAEYDYKHLIAQPDMQVADMPDIKQFERKGRIDRKEVVAAGLENVRSKNNPYNTGNDVYVENRYTGRPIQVNENSIRHGLDGKLGRLSRNSRVGAIIGDVVANAIPVNEMQPRGSKVRTFVMFGMAQDTESFYPTRLVVEERNHKIGEITELEFLPVVNKQVLYAANARMAEKNRTENTPSSVKYVAGSAARKGASGLDTSALALTKTASDNTVDTISIANMLEIVKEHFTDSISLDVLEHFGLERPKNKFSDGLKFSLKEPVEQTRELVALHNLNDYALKSAIDMGGFPMPSIAITKANIGHEGFGDISVVFGKETIDPKAMRANKVYGDDVWTPTFPEVHFKLDEDVAHRNYADIGNILEKHGYDEINATSLHPANIESAIDRANGDVIAALKNENVLQMAYALDKNIEFEPVYKDVRYASSFENKQLQAVIDEFGERTINKFRTDIELAEKNDVRFRKALKQPLGDKGRRFYNEPLTYSQMLQVVDGSSEMIADKSDTGEYGTKKVIDSYATLKEVEKNIDMNAFENWLDERYGDIIIKKGVRNKKDLYTPSGNLRSFDVTHDEMTLENVVNIMKKEKPRAVGVFQNARTFKAAAAKGYNSIKALLADKHRIQDFTQKEYDQITKAYEDRVYSIAYEVANADVEKSGSWQMSKHALENMVDAVAKHSTVDGIVSYIQQFEDMTINKKLAQEILDVAEVAKELPIRYFEAKPQRAIGLDEVKAVVLPADKYAEIKQQLNDRGVATLEYNPDIEGDRARVMNSEEVNAVKFSLKDASEVDTNKLIKENEQLQEANALLKQQFELTKGKVLDQKKVEQLSRKLLKEYNSSYDVGSFAEGLQQIFDYINKSEQPVWEQIQKTGIRLARTAIEQSSTFDTESFEHYAPLRDYLRSTGITLSETQKAEAARSHDSYNNYRKSLFGSVKLVNGGVNLDVAWGELADQYPALFEFDTNEGDMVTGLEQASMAIRKDNFFENPYGYSMDEAAADMFLRIYDEYFNVPEVKTFADKKQSELTQLHVKYRNQIDTIRTDSKERYNSRLKKLKADNIAARQELAAKYREAKAQNKTELMKKYREMYQRRSDKLNAKLMEQKAALKEWKIADRGKRKVREQSNKYKTRIMKNVKELTEWIVRPTDKRHVPQELQASIGAFVETIDFSSKRAPKRTAEWANRMAELQNKMQELEHSDEGFAGFASQMDPDFIPMLQVFLHTNKNSVNTIAEMNQTQLKDLDHLVRIVRHAVTQANVLHANAQYQTVAEVGEATKAQLGKRKSDRARGKVANAIHKTLNISQLDAFAYADELGEAGGSVIEAMRKGFDKKVVNVKRTTDYVQAVIKGKNIKSWTGRNAQIQTVQLTNGTVQMTPAQLMELYTLGKRKQAYRHLIEGGIVVRDYAAKQGGRVKRVKMDAPVQLVAKDLRTIRNALTDDQIFVADRLQKFLATETADWGNEASLIMYGYEKFNEADYFPITSDPNYLQTNEKTADEKNAGLYDIRNMGMTKATTPHAKNPIMIGDMFTTFTKHIDQMTAYNAFVVPLTDAMKWYNYRGDGYTSSVKQEIQRTLGSEGKQYFINLIKDVNGSASDTHSKGFSIFLNNAKVAAVGANIRVVLQQPTAYVRAMSIIDPQYLMGAMFKFPNVKRAKQYAPIAQWKSWGFYDLNVETSLRDVIVKDASGLAKAKEASLAMVGWADDITWGSLWNACEMETKAKRKDLKVGTEEFYKAVGERLSYVVDRTQVVDTVFHRSQLMRSKFGLMNLYTAFMAEPTKSYNMLRSSFSAYNQSKTAKNASNVVRTATSFVLSSFATAAAAAVVDAFRYKDPEDEKEWLERYKEHLQSNFIGNVNPLALLPVGKDIFSMIEGFQPSRLDLRAFTDFIDVGKEFFKLFEGESKWSMYKYFTKLSSAFSSLTGIPLSNVVRTFQTIYNNYSEQGIDMENPTATNKKGFTNMYEALIAGDKEGYSRLKATMHEKIYKKELEEGGTKEEIEQRVAEKMEKAMREMLRDNEPRIAAMADMRRQDTLNLIEYKKLRNELLDKGFTDAEITGAVNSVINKLNKEGKEPTEAAEQKDFKMQELYQYMYGALTSGDLDTYAELEQEALEQIRETVEKSDTQYDDIETEIDNRLIQGMRGYLKEHDKRIERMATAVDESDLTTFEQYESELFNEGFTEQMIWGAVKAFKSEDELSVVNEVKAKDDMFFNKEKDFTPAVARYVEQGDPAMMSRMLEDMFDEEERADSFKSALYKNMNAKLGEGDLETTNLYISVLKAEAGRKDTDIGYSITLKFREKYITYRVNGQDREADELAGQLQSLDLYQKNGSHYFNDSKLNGWIEKYYAE